jgi:hypothetical protein
VTHLGNNTRATAHLKLVECLKASRRDLGVTVAQSTKEGIDDSVRFGANGGIPRSTDILRYTIFDHVSRTTFSESHVEMKGWGNEIDVFTDGLGDRVRGARDVWTAIIMIINVVFGVQKILGVSNG